MKRIITMFVLLAIGAGLSAQQNRHSNYIGIELGAGINNLGHNADNGAFYVGWGFQGGLRYAHFFGEHFGMGLGVQASRIFADDRVPQRKMMSYLNIPVKFYWRTPVCEKWAFLFGLGGSVDMPLLGSDSMTKKIGASLVVDLGFNYELCDHWGLYMGLYGGYSFTDMYEGDVQIKDLRLLQDHHRCCCRWTALPMSHHYSCCSHNHSRNWCRYLLHPISGLVCCWCR